MDKKRILVTGGAGFIGSHLVEYLIDHNYSVTVLDNCLNGCKIPDNIISKIHFIHGDVRSYETVKKAVQQVEYIIHLAAMVGVEDVINQPMETIEIETLGTLNIVQAASEYGIKKIIYASSSAVYKNTLGESSQENDPLFLVNGYAVAKRTNELYLQALMAEKGISTISLRFFNVYGAHQDERMVIPRFINQAINNQAINVFGDGSQIRDFTIIDDVLESIHQLLFHPTANGVFNVAGGNGVSIKTLAYMIKKITNSSSIINFLDFPINRLAYKVQKRIGNSNKLFETIGFKPNCSVEEGLKKIIVAPVSNLI